jgi:hypothetical protein
MAKNRLTVASVIDVVNFIPLHGFMAYRAGIVSFWLHGPVLCLETNTVPSMVEPCHKPYLLESPNLTGDGLP